MNTFGSFHSKKESSHSRHHRRARRHRNSRRHLSRPLLTRFSCNFDLLQAILAIQSEPNNADHQLIHFVPISADGNDGDADEGGGNDNGNGNGNGNGNAAADITF
jgi:hypothetical protein